MATNQYKFYGTTLTTTDATTLLTPSAAGAGADTPGADSDLADRHEALRSKVRTELDRLDSVIDELEQ